MRLNHFSRSPIALFTLLSGLVMLTACGSQRQPSAPMQPAAAMPVQASVAARSPQNGTLYQALGGQSGIERLSENFIIELAADETTASHFKNSDIGRFHTMLQQQVCQLSGGPCVYSGDDMKRTHGGMDITSVEFNAVVEALMRAMDKTGIRQGAQNRLLALMAPMHPDIVGQ